MYNLMIFSGATSAVAVTVKDRHENEHKVAGEL